MVSRVPPKEPSDIQYDRPQAASTDAHKRKITLASKKTAKTDRHVKEALSESGFYPPGSKRPRGRFT